MSAGTAEVVRKLPKAYREPVNSSTQPEIQYFFDGPRDPSFAVKESVTDPGKFSKYMIAAHHSVKASGLYNFQGCKIPVWSKFNLTFIERQLRGYQYEDMQVISLLKYGFPLGHFGPVPTSKKVRNHKGAREFPTEVQKYLQEQIGQCKIIGPFTKNPLGTPLKYSPLNTVPKKGSDERRIIGVKCQ